MSEREPRSMEILNLIHQEPSTNSHQTRENPQPTTKNLPQRLPSSSQPPEANNTHINTPTTPHCPKYKRTNQPPANHKVKNQPPPPTNPPNPTEKRQQTTRIKNQTPPSYRKKNGRFRPGSCVTPRATIAAGDQSPSAGWTVGTARASRPIAQGIGQQGGWVRRGTAFVSCL